jgi:Leucine-rich repeat (LRR) protein
MTKKLSIAKENNKLVLSKTRGLISITNKVLDSKKNSLYTTSDFFDDAYFQYLDKQYEELNLYRNEENLTEIDEILQELSMEENKALVNDSWMERLFEWADKHSIPNLEYQDKYSLEECLIGFPRKREILLKCEKLNLSFCQLIELPEEIKNFASLKYLNLGYNQLKKLPKEIIKLSNLRTLHLIDNQDLILSLEQKEWILNLKKNNCEVTIDNKLLKKDFENNPLRLIDIVQKLNNTKDGIFGNINNDLNEFSMTSEFENNMLMKMAYAYARRSVAAGLFLQGLFSRQDYKQASTIFKILQRQTGQSVEFQKEASTQALELLSSYSLRLTNTMISKIVSAVELEQVVSAYEYNKYYQFDDTLDFFDEKYE